MSFDLLDDVLCAHRPTLNVLAHRPCHQDSLETACGAHCTDGYQHYGAWLAIREIASPCRQPSCFPRGWL